MRLLFLMTLFTLMQACSKPVDSLKPLPRIAVVAIYYDMNIYQFLPTMGIQDTMFAKFSGKVSQRSMHETLLNQFFIEFMRRTKQQSNISIVRPLKLLDTSLMKDKTTDIVYEYLLDPYDPIDISNQVFMAGLAERLNVDAVAEIRIRFAINTDEVTLWEEYADPYAETLVSQRMQVRAGHETSHLRTIIELIVVDRFANKVYEERRFVDTQSDHIVIDDYDLAFDGGVSPKLLEQGLMDWIYDWVEYLPKYSEEP